MRQTTVTESVKAPAELVWDLVTDIEGSPAHITAIIKVERLDEGSNFGVGFRWKETRRMFGQEASETMEVTEIEPGRSYTTEAASHGSHYTSVIEVSPTETGCELSMKFSSRPTNLISRIASPIMGAALSRSVRKALAQDLQQIKEAAEARVASASDEDHD